ncbi:hypothetical protein PHOOPHIGHTERS_2 [Serratia phage vB_SmaS_PhooPhighters]|nr:hypothetical protein PHOOPHIGHTERS_2 [Serratia phage vB_SmaS_PhooPhighters]
MRLEFTKQPSGSGQERSVLTPIMACAQIAKRLTALDAATTAITSFLYRKAANHTPNQIYKCYAMSAITRKQPKKKQNRKVRKIEPQFPARVR